MIQALSDYYCVPEDLLDRPVVFNSSGDVGFFLFGSKAICYGRCASGVSANIENASLYDASLSVHLNEMEIRLPFDPDQVIENLRHERYIENLVPDRERFVTQEWIRKAYYFVRTLLPVSVRQHLQRVYFSDWRSRPFPRCRRLKCGARRQPPEWRSARPMSGRRLHPRLRRLRENKGRASPSSSPTWPWCRPATSSAATSPRWPLPARPPPRRTRAPNPGLPRSRRA